MNAHTPGPWSLGEGEYEDHVFGPDGFEVMGAPTHASIHREFYARRMGDGHWATTPGAFIERGDEVPRANARLTAAAPDLFTQLKGMLGLAEFLINAVDVDTDRTKVVLRHSGKAIAEVPISVIIEHTKAAIAKAQGVEHG